MKNGTEIDQGLRAEVKTPKQLAQEIVVTGVQLLEGQNEVSRESDGIRFKILASDTQGSLTIQADYSTAVKKSYRYPPTYELEPTLVGFFLMHDTYELSQDGANRTTIREVWTGDDYLPEEFNTVPSVADLQNLLSGLQQSTEFTGEERSPRVVTI